MSALGAVLAEARAGGSATTIATRLGLAPDLVEAMLDQGQRLGLLGSARAACGSCAAVAPSGPGSTAVLLTSAGSSPAAVAPPGRACAGCPLAARS